LRKSCINIMFSIFGISVTPIDVPVVTGLKGRQPGDAPALFASLLSAIIGFLLVVASLWAFFQLIQAGILWISSEGDKTKIETARHRITDAIMGLFIVFASWAVFLLILQFLGMTSGGPGINLKFPTIY